VFPRELSHYCTFSVTTNLAAFFRLAQQCVATDPALLSAKSKFARILFGDYAHVDIATLWARARALSLVIGAHDGKPHSCTLHHAYGTEIVPIIMRARIPSARVAAANETVAWEAGHLFVGNTNKVRGWDILICGEGYTGQRVHIMEVALVGKPKESLVQVVAKRLTLALEDRCVAEGQHLAGRKRNFLAHMVFVFTVYENIDFRNAVSAEKVLKYMGKRLAKATDKADVKQWKRAMEFVRKGFSSNVFFLSKKDLDEGMPPVLVPIAALVKMTA
jgi:hypothetical protein